MNWKKLLCCKNKEKNITNASYVHQILSIERTFKCINEFIQVFAKSILLKNNKNQRGLLIHKNMATAIRPKNLTTNWFGQTVAETN